MAITFEEDKNKINWFGFLSIIVVVGFIGIAVFYLFFSKSPAVDKFLFPKLQNLSAFKDVNFDFEAAINNPAFKNFKILVNFNVPSSDQIGKANPFIK